MAKLHGNELLQLSGKIGGIVIRITRHGSIACRLPYFGNTVFSAPQKRSCGHFGKAVEYAKYIIADPKRKAAYKKTITNGSSVYHAAIAEYMSFRKKKKLSK